VFEENPWPEAVNGSLWTLPVEFFCYLAVLGLAVLGALVRALRLAAAAAVAAIGGLVLTHAYDGPQIVIYATDLRWALQIIPYFLVGAIFAVAPQWLPLRADAALGVTFALVAAEHLLPTAALRAVGYLGVPYVVLAFGTAATPGLARAGRWGDVSYGMYLYAFPVQQTLIALTQAAISPAALIVATTALSVTLAWASWHLVEKPCLGLKPRAPAAVPTARAPDAAPGDRLPAH
jgi:peptidoglycan/LPS O-acetylase OafA/YrhL